MTTVTLQGNPVHTNGELLALLLVTLDISFYGNGIARGGLRAAAPFECEAC